MLTSFKRQCSILLLAGLLFILPNEVLAKKELIYYCHSVQQDFPVGTEFLWVKKGNPGISEYFKNQHQSTSVTPLTLSNQDAVLWIKIPLNTSIIGQENQLLIPNSHINLVQGFYINGNNQIVDSTKLFGDHQPFSARPIEFPEFIFPLHKTGASHIILFLDKSNEPFFTSVQIINSKALESRKTEFYLLSGILVGILIAAFIINGYIVINARKVLNYLYTIFLALIIIYTLSDFGYIHWFINYRSHWIIDIIRPLSLSLAFPIYLFFFLQTISLHQHFPVWHQRIKKFGQIWLTYVIIASAISPFLYDNNYKYYSLGLSLLFQQITLLIVIAVSIISIRKKDFYAVPFLITSFLFLTSHLQYLGHRFGYLDDTVIQLHFVPIILSMDCFIMGGIVAIRFVDFVQKNKELAYALISKEKEIADRIANVQLRELSRISQLLHNHIGIELIGLQSKIEKVDNEIPTSLKNELKIQTQRLIEDVRNTAHFLSPQVLKRFGISHCLRLLLKEICQSKNLDYHLEITNECDALPMNIQLVILLTVQECLNNTIKHAAASSIDVQCFIENNHAYFSYQDDGLGFIIHSEQSNGIGLTQIQEMIQVCEGQCKIESEPKEGMVLNAEIPLKK